MPLKKAVSKKSAETAVKSSGQKKLLSGGNPQIQKGDGDEFVQAYIAAVPGWKKEACRKLDALIEKSAKGVQKAIRWNSPFYGMKGEGWFLSFHCFNKYIKVAFLRGKTLKPPPPIESKIPLTRYIHIFENEEIDVEQLKKWIKQASSQPGEPVF